MSAGRLSTPCVTHRRRRPLECNAHSAPWLLLLQVLELPALGQADRQALGHLASLTRLSFAACGQGAVGPSLLLLPLKLADLTVHFCHGQESFIVSHPAADWAALRQLASLRRLRLRHLAVNTFFAAPEVTWLDEAPPAHQADLLLAALPHIELLELR